MMKSSITLLSIFFLLILSAGCKREPATLHFPPYPGPVPPPTKPQLQKNTALGAHAGQDRTLKLLLGEITLQGSGHDAEDNIQSFEWEKISGPNSCLIENKNDLITKISGLEKGVYQFELTATDSKGLFNKDTVKITVEALNVNPQGMVFNSLEWIFPWYNAIEISNFSHLTPSATSFNVFIQRNGSAEWKKVSVFDPHHDAGIKYEYFIETRSDGGGIYHSGSLYIFYYGMDVSDTPSVKIEY